MALTESAFVLPPRPFFYDLLGMFFGDNMPFVASRGICRSDATEDGEESKYGVKTVRYVSYSPNGF